MNKNDIKVLKENYERYRERLTDSQAAQSPTALLLKDVSEL